MYPWVAGLSLGLPCFSQPSPPLPDTRCRLQRQELSLNFFSSACAPGFLDSKIFPSLGWFHLCLRLGSQYIFPFLYLKLYFYSNSPMQYYLYSMVLKIERFY